MGKSLFSVHLLTHFLSDSLCPSVLCVSLSLPMTINHVSMTLSYYVSIMVVLSPSVTDHISCHRLFVPLVCLSISQCSSVSVSLPMSSECIRFFFVHVLQTQFTSLIRVSLSILSVLYSVFLFRFIIIYQSTVEAMNLITSDTVYGIRY